MKAIPPDSCRIRMPTDVADVMTVFLVSLAFLGACCSRINAQQDNPVNTLDAVVQQAEQARIDAIAKAKRAAISIFDPDGKGGGSGVVISADGYALTNFHVVQPCGDFMRCSMSDGKLYEAVLVGLDPTGDVAMIKLLGRNDFPVAEISDSDQVRVGEWCFAVGNPFLLATDRQPTITYGIVSGVHRYQYPAGSLLEYADCIQTDASINPGNSGGPLFNARGQLIGVNGRGSFEKRGRVNVGVGYAISINQIKHFEGCLRSGRIVDHATLGATVSNSDGRVVVSNILESSDAWRRGLRYDDHILSFADREIHSVNDFKNVLGIFPKGWRVPIVFERDGKQQSITVRLEGVHAGNTLVDLVQGGSSGQAEDVPKPDDERSEDAEPKEKDDGKPDEGKPEKGGEKDSELPDGIPFDAPHAKQKAEIPDSARPFIEARRGYANYYFNRLNRDRLWDAWSGELDLAEVKKSWKLFGELEKVGAVEILVGDVVSGGRFPSGPELIDLKTDLTEQLRSNRTANFLLTLSIWRQLISEGPKRYGDVYYFGKLPLPSRRTVGDVLVATRDVVETHFYFDDSATAAAGSPIAIEMFPDVDAEPCVVFLSDFRKAGKSLMPHRIQISIQGEGYGTLKVREFQFVAPDQKQKQEQ